MKNSEDYFQDYSKEGSFIDKEAIYMYLGYWKWFLISVAIALFIGFLYMRYTSVKYSTTAKIKVIDNSKELDIAADPLSVLNTTPKINLDNEIEVIKSYRLLKQVVDELSLDVSYYEIGNVKKSQKWHVPFIVAKSKAIDNLTSPIEFYVRIEGQKAFLSDNNKEYSIDMARGENLIETPFFSVTFLKNAQKGTFEDLEYEVIITPIKETVLKLAKDLNVEATSKSSEVLALSLTGESAERSESILNTLVDKFNDDGIRDRQLVSQRTIDFIDERFIYLTDELDSIEVGKQNFKRENNLSYIEEDASITLQKKSLNESEAFNLQSQLSIARLLRQTLQNQDYYRLLPANIGLENQSVNDLVNTFNELALKREKFMASANEDHPMIQVLNNQLQSTRKNILNTINIYVRQLQTSLGQRNYQKDQAGNLFSRLPEKEKILRSIERQQSIKENLFLILLEKKEEAAIENAVTAPSIKVVDYGLTASEPVSPKGLVVYPISLLLGFLLPFGVLATQFAFDTKLHNREDLEKLASDTPIIAEIPKLGEEQITNRNDHSILSESFRILGTNANYILKSNIIDGPKIIFVTSSIKGEGKTLIALHLSLSYANLNKKVLLVGADLRNPQLKKQFNIKGKVQGLSEYLNGSVSDWKECISKPSTEPNLHVCFAGRIPPNAPELLSGKRFEKFLDYAKQDFDYIIIDTAPTLLVTDTLLISQYADLTLFVTRSEYTEKKLLDFALDLKKEKKLKKMAFVINDVSSGKFMSYNYGYGYGYNNENYKEEESWLSELIKKSKSMTSKIRSNLKLF